jgi:hypothetical protein
MRLIEPDIVTFQRASFCHDHARKIRKQDVTFTLQRQCQLLGNKETFVYFQEMSKKLSDDKKISRKEKDERILWKKNEVAEYEATTFAIFYNNALFLSILILVSFYILKNFSPHLNYILSMGLASGAIALLSTGTKI